VRDHHHTPPPAHAVTSPANPTVTNTPVDLLVVGGGLMGLGVAWRCAARGMRVRLLDRGDLGRGASWAAAGMLAPCTEAQFHEDAVYALSAQSQDLWPQFAADVEAASGLSVGFDTCGSIVVALDRDDDAAQRRHFAYQQSLGMQVERLSGAALREREPLLSPKAIAGTWSPVEHQVDNRLLVDALIAACTRAGVALEPHRAVTAVHVGAGQVGGAIGDDGVLRPARAVLIAGGAWSRAIEGLGDVTPPVRPVKGQMLSLATEPRYQLAHVIRSAYGYIAPKADRWVVGATSEDRGFDVRVTAGGVWHLLDGAYRAVPASHELPLLETWAGLRPASRDTGPIMGDCDVRGLYFCTGHYRHGVQMTPASVNGVAACIAGEPAWSTHAPFNARRFAAGAAHG
jgi:glycine oxidase